MSLLKTLRNNLGPEHRLFRVLTSGIGEVIMVMVGVLLALCVQNWNDDRKDTVKETKLLREMRENLNADLTDCRWNIDFNERALHANRNVLRHLEERTPYTDTMRIHYATLFGCTQLVANTSAFDNLKSIGFNLIRTDSLRKGITGLYAERYRFVAMTESEYDTHLQMVDMGPHIYSKLIVETVWKSAYPIDVEALSGDNGFKGVLRMNIFTKGFMTGIYKAVERQVQALITLIDAELEQRRP